MKVAQSCPTLCNPMDYTVHGILQARILEWIAFPFSSGSSQPRDGTQVSCIAARYKFKGIRKSIMIILISQKVILWQDPEYSLEGLILKLQYFGHLMWRVGSLENILMLGKIEGGRRRGWQKMRWLDGITDAMGLSLIRFGSWWWTVKPGMLQSMESQSVGHNWVTELKWLLPFHCSRIYGISLLVFSLQAETLFCRPRSI